jgi:SsrA-binding protein
MKIVNKKASYNYELLDRLEVGIVLTGAEVKSIRSGRCNMGDAFVKILNGELWVINLDIPKYKYDGSEIYDAAHTRKLLIRKSQLYSLSSKMKQGNLTLVPVSIYTSRGRVKLEIALARGKKDREKKNKEKERDLDRELLREKRKFMI